MKPRNKTVEMKMQGTQGLSSVSFIKQALPVIDRFIWWQESWLTLILYIDLKVLGPVWFMWASTSRHKRRASEAVYII